jgi:hypothetical protein
VEFEETLVVHTSTGELAAGLQRPSVDPLCWLEGESRKSLQMSELLGVGWAVSAFAKGCSVGGT